MAMASGMNAKEKGAKGMMDQPTDERADQPNNGQSDPLLERWCTGFYLRRSDSIGHYAGCLVGRSVRHPFAFSILSAD